MKSCISVLIERLECSFFKLSLHGSKLSPEKQEEISEAILQYADDNDNMGQRATRLFMGDEAFIRDFYNAYLQGEMLDMWDAPTVNIQKLVAILEAIQEKR